MPGVALVISATKVGICVIFMIMIIIIIIIHSVFDISMMGMCIVM